MVLTKLSLVAATTLTLGIVASGAYVWGVPQRESEAPAKSSSAGRQAQTDEHRFGEGQNLLAILQRRSMRERPSSSVRRLSQSSQVPSRIAISDSESEVRTTSVMLTFKRQQ